MWHKIGTVIQILALVVSAIALVFVARTAHIAKSEFEAKNRPYLSIQDICVMNEQQNRWLDIVIEVVNRGEVPAMKVTLKEIVMGGERIAWMSDYDEDYPPITYTTGNITITSGGIIIPPQRRDFPSEIIFFPDQVNKIVVPAHRTTWETTISEGSIMDIGLSYSWGDKDFWYVATAILEKENQWSINLHRGN